ncbi:MAG: hypothetical protein ACYSTY_02880 [Planctomycetota bacterium]
MLKHRAFQQLGQWRGAWDYFLRPHLRQSWGGPFNGQQHRREIFLELLQLFRFRAIVETGAYRGTTTEFLADTCALPVYSVEIQPRYFSYAKLRLRRLSHVDLRLADSRAFLRELARDDAVVKSHVFFYLDAHWGHGHPLREEVEMIVQHWRESIVMIDDFQVPDDDGYGYDVLDDGTKLSLACLQPLSQFGQVAFPAAPSAGESGARRGCVVLATADSAAEALTKATSLRALATVPR